VAAKSLGNGGLSITLSNLDFLTSDAGASLLQRLALEDLSEANTLALLTRLRKEYDADQARAALTLAQLRRKAEAKFGAGAARMYFTADALEQASDPRISKYRAQTAIGLRVVDAGCGIGADSLAMARAGGDVLGLDSDPLRIAMARLNAAALSLSARFEVADIRDGLPSADFAFFDPARRDSDGKRMFRVEDYQPPLSIVRSWDVPRIAVKLSPGVNLDELRSYNGSVEFISVEGDLKEAVLWLGLERPSLQAVLIAGDDVHIWSQPNVMPDAPTAEPHGWLVEPDPALLRAGLVQAVAPAFEGALLDETIAYFTTPTKPDSVWVRGWQILDWMPFHLKRLRAYLRERNIGRVTVKKRGLAITPEELTAKLKLQGEGSCTLVLTRLRGEPVVLICADYEA
jgi:SAM-dependent methyltransferase